MFLPQMCILYTSLLVMYVCMYVCSLCFVVLLIKKYTFQKLIFGIYLHICKCFVRLFLPTVANIAVISYDILMKSEERFLQKRSVNK